MNAMHGSPSPKQRETEMIGRLRRRPDLWERFEAILALTEVEEGELRTAESIQALLVEEVRRLGSAAMHRWAAQAGARTGREFAAAHPRVAVGEKKALSWWGVFGSVTVRERLWREPGQSDSAAFRAARAGERAGQVAAPASGP